MKTIIERGASWTLEETKMLLALWGQDLVQRQKTNQKRTKEVYEKISEKFIKDGYERTADQVRTRVFNMIAEYRRILKDPNPERMKKCIFFEALHKIYNAKHMNDVKSALDDYEPDGPYSPASNTISSDKGDESISDSEAIDGNETTINNNWTSTNANSSTINNNNATAAATVNTNSTSTDNNNGDSNNNNSTEKESTSTPSQQSATGAAAKKIKLDSPKSGSNQSATPAASTSTTNSSSDHTNFKQSSKSSSSTSHVAFIAGSSSTTAATATTSSSTTSSSSSVSSQKHQSLLMPHATTSASSSLSATTTPISKLTTSGSNNTPSYINIKSTQLPIIRTNQLLGHSNGNESINLNGTTTTRLPTTAAIASHQLYQAPVNTFDVTSSALLIDRMFAHLSRESENMREWIALEKERLALERARRQQETEREARRERILIDTLMRFQEQWLSFLSRLDPRIVENASEEPPELKVSPKEGQTTTETSQTTQTSNAGSATSSNNLNPPLDAGKQ